MTLKTSLKQLVLIKVSIAFLCFLLVLGNATESTKLSASGIVALLRSDKVDQPGPDISKIPVEKLRFLSGLSLRTWWDKVESEKGKFNWSHFDQGVAVAEKNKIFVGLAVASGVGTPQWTYSSSSKPFSFEAPPGPEQGKKFLIPFIWDEVYLTNYRELISSFGRKYDENPAVAYITMAGMGFAYETYLPRGEQYEKWLKAGGDLSKWVEASKKIIDMYAAAFKITPLILAMGEPIPTSEGREALVALTEYGLTHYPGRFGLMNHGLNAVSQIEFYPNKMISEHAEKVPVGFQMVWATTGQGAKQLKGTLEDSLKRGISFGAHFIEVYGEDCAKPEFTKLLESSSEQLKANFQKLTK